MNHRTYLWVIVNRDKRAIMRNIQIATTRIIAGIWPASFYQLTVNKLTMGGDEILGLWHYCHNLFYFDSTFLARMTLLHSITEWLQYHSGFLFVQIKTREGMINNEITTR